MLIRPETKDDQVTIHELTRRAFAPMPFSSGTEAQIIDQLRVDGDLTVSLVAIDADHIVGHIAFSPATIDGEHNGWYGLGPVSVCPERQKQGIGSRLIESGLARIRASGATGCVLIGDPNYYHRFDFISDGLLTYGDVPSQYVQSVSFRAQPANGVLKFASAFERQPH